MNNQRKFTVEKHGAGARRPFKAPRWSHQKELDGLKGEKVVISLVDTAEIIQLTLLEADQFALKVKDDDGRVKTFFKHNIAGYWAA